MEEYQQNPPFCIQIELVEGCNLKCSFCGVQGMREKPGNYLYMNPNLLRRIARQIHEAGWNSRIEFAMHGEPSLHPQLVEMITLFHEESPKSHLMMTSNGGGLVKDPQSIIDGLFNAGLTTLALDRYEGVPIVDKILNKYKVPDNIDFYKYPQQEEGNPHSRRRRKALVIISDIEQETKGVHATLTNHCGAGMPLDFSKSDKQCAKPFRELSIRWNGMVSICCNDFRGVSKFGDCKTESLPELWNNEKFQAARRFLFHGRRTITPCLGCNYTTYRNGLLPDNKGRVKLNEPSEKDFLILKEASSGIFLSSIVLRNWEK